MQDGTEPFAEAVDDQLDAVALWWRTGAPAGPGFTMMAPKEPLHDRHDVERWLDGSGIRNVEKGTPLVLFITGHGLTSAAGNHYAQLMDTDPARLPATGLRTTEMIAAALDSLADDVLVIVNTCASADVGSEVLALERELSAERRTTALLNVLVTSAPQRKVLGREFALTLRRAHAWLSDPKCGITRRYLTMSEFHEALVHATRTINSELHRNLEGPRPVLTGKLHVPTLALPNPGYRPQATTVADARREVAATPDDLDYWLEKASGRVNDLDPGWYFSGRRHLNADLAAFLSGPAGTLVVTGIAASGKSALLARAVTFSDAGFRAGPQFAAAVAYCPPDTLPEQGSVTVAVDARQQEPLPLLRTLCRKLGVKPDPTAPDPLRRWQAGLRAHLRTPGPVITVVVDALDEATDPRGCITQVLEPLAEVTPPDPAAPAPVPGRPVRLLVAVRSSIPAGTAPAPGAAPTPTPGAATGTALLAHLEEAVPRARVLRVDGPDMREDIHAYVRALLHGEDLWPDTGQAESAADIVAAACSRSFIDARVAADQLRARGPALLSDASWLGRLAQGTMGLLTADLEQAAEEGLAEAEAVALLRATAFALGRGIPWGEVWPAVASALLGRPIESADDKIRTLLGGRLAGYLTHDTEDDHRVYRPAHDRMAAVLRSRPGEPDVQGGGNAVTARQEPDDDARGDAGAQDGAGTGAQDGAGTGAQDGAGDGAHGEAAAHARIAEALARLVGPHPLGSPAPYVRAHLARHARLGGVLDDEHVPKEVLPWLTGSPVRGLLAGLPPADADAVANADAGAPGRGDRAWLQAWAMVEPYLGQAGLPSRIASLHLARASLAAAARTDPDPAPEPAYARLPGSPLAVLWSQWAPVGNVLARTAAVTQAMTVLPADDGTRRRPLLAVGDDRGGIELVDAVEGSAVGERIPAHEGVVCCLTTAERPGLPPLLVSGSHDGTVRFWNPGDVTLVDQVNRPGDVWIDDLAAFTDTEDEAVVLSVNGDGTVVRWQERFGPEEAATLPGRRPRSTPMAVTTVRGRNAGDGADEGPGEGPGAGPGEGAGEGAGRRPAEDPLPVIAIADGTRLAFHDAETFELIEHFDLASAVRVLARTTRPDRIAAGHADGTITVWERAGQRAALKAADDPVTGLTALTHAHGHLLAAGTGGSSDITVWDPDSGSSGVLAGHSDTVTALTRVPVPDGLTADTDVLVSAARDKTLRLWNGDHLTAALTTRHSPRLVSCAALAPGGPPHPPWLALCGSGPGIEIRDTATGRTAATIGTTTPPTALTWGPGPEDTGGTGGTGPTRTLYWAEPGHGIGAWDAGTRRPADRFPAGPLPVHSLAACTTADGRRLLLSGGEDFRVKLWDPADPRTPLHDWPGHRERVNCVAAATDGRHDWFASASSDGTARLWSRTGDGPLGDALKCDQGCLRAVALNPRPTGGLGPHLATAGDDGRIQLWDLHTRTRLPGPPLTGHTAAVHALALWSTARGNFLASGSGDGTIRVWSAEAGGTCLLKLAVVGPVRHLTAHPAPTPERVVLAFSGPAGAAAVVLDLTEVHPHTE
ncbi:hypothetical protein [Streptomyces sp. NPDC089799]|uniref:hypothetical protein n=1 Tax=Streptomyces sp. NPDC089799 TaxID=3155066 RepID=UPI00342B73B2